MYQFRAGYLPTRTPSHEAATIVAKGLGYFSIALGLAELLRPRQLSDAVGAGEHDQLVRGFGLREMAAGAAILTQKDPTPWVWARVAGDALDLAGLATTLRRDNPHRGAAWTAFGAVAAITVLDLFCASVLTETAKKPPRPMVRDYSDRSGMPRPPREMRGIARDAIGR